MSRHSFDRLAKSLHDTEKVALAQSGHKAANAAQLRRPIGGGTGVAGRGLTSKGLYPWDKAYLDTNEIDVWTKDGVTGEVVRLRVTAMRDGATKLVLAQVTEAHDPNEETYLELFRECVERWNRFPRRLAMDNAKIAKGTTVVSFCATYICEREFGPRGHGRFRSEIETVFKTLNARAHLAEGNSEPSKNVRALSPSHQPEGRALWPHGRLEDEVVKRVFYEEINRRIDPIDGLSAEQRYEARMVADGSRRNDLIAFDATFMMLSAPPVDSHGPSAGQLLVTAQGVRGERGEHFTCEALTETAVLGTYVRAKREPWDISVRYVQVDDRWHVARSEALAEHLAGRTRREVRRLSREIRVRLGRAPDLSELGRYIADLRATESELRKTEKRARMLRAARPAATPLPPRAEVEDALDALDPGEIEPLSAPPSRQSVA